MASITAGLVGGLVATIVMTAVMMVAGDDSPPPTAALVAKFADGEPADYEMPGMLLHLGYGVVAGAVFVVAVPALGLGFDLGDIVVATALGIVYSIILLVIGMVFWMRLIIGMEPDAETMVQMGVVHVVYGLVLGAFVGAGILA